MGSGAAHRLQEYAANWLAVDIKNDYERQLRKWDMAVNDLIAACATAIQRHGETLDAAKALDRFSYDLVLLALSIVSAGSMRWIGAAIEHKLAPKMFPKEVTRRVQLHWYPPPNSKYKGRYGRPGEMTMTVDGYNEIAGYAFGEIGMDIGLGGVDYAKLNYSQGIPTDLTAAYPPKLEAKDVFTLQARFKNLLNNSITLQSTEIVRLARRIRESDDFGEKYLRLAKGNEDAAKEEIRRRLQDVRQKWAREWDHYGNNPVRYAPTSLANMIEKEIWALWILAQNIKIKKVAIGTDGRRILYTDVLSKEISSAIIDRLEDLMVVFAWDSKVKMSNQLTQIRIRHGRLTKAQAKELDILQVWHVDGAVDTPAEFQDLVKWAESHKVGIYAQGPTKTPRKLGSLEKINDPEEAIGNQ